MSNRNSSRFTPLIIAISIVVGILIGTFYAQHFAGNKLGIINSSSNKLNALLRVIDDQYVDTVNMTDLVEKAMGNCYAELGQLDKAASLLLKAADEADNNSLSPIYLLQAGEILVKQGKYDDAINAYTKIKDKYFRSYQAMDIDKYIEQAKLLKK